MVKDYLKYKWAEFLEEREFRKRFPDQPFHALDRSLKRLYWFENPYRICKYFLEMRGEEDVHQYGETPLRTMYKIAYAAGVTDKDHFFELGCGRGRACFFVSHHFQCKVTGVEQIPVFVNRAVRTAIKHSLLEPKFIKSDFLQADLSDATVVYLYGTCLPDRTVVELCKKIPHGCKTISVSYPLSDYDERFRILKKCTGEYPWGNTEVFIESCDHSLGMRGV